MLGKHLTLERCQRRKRSLCWLQMLNLFVGLQNRLTQTSAQAQMLLQRLVLYLPQRLVLY